MENNLTFKKITRRRCTIVNRTEQLDKACYLDVPVNSNHFNRKRFVQDWTFRSYVEWKTSACSFFTTLTFDEVSLPRFVDGRPCFDESIISPFLKKLRYELSRVGLPWRCMKFFLVSEYGKTTHRPHHHCMFFFKQLVIPAVFQACLRKSWKYGFVDCEIPDSNRVLTYVSKYVCKDVYAFNGDVCKSRFDPEVTQECKKYIFGSGWETHKLTLYNFHRQSLGFGIAYESCISKDDWLSGIITVAMDGQKTMSFAIPKYYRDRVLSKLVYYKDDEGKRRGYRVTTPLGEEVRESTIDHNIDSYEKLVSKLIKNTDKILDEYGIDVDPDVLSLNNAWSSCSCFDTTVSPRDALRDYLLTKRYKPIVPREGYCNVIRFDNKVSIPVLWNTRYRGFEDWLSLLDDINFIMDKFKQRYEEREEFRRFFEKKRSGKRYY